MLKKIPQTNLVSCGCVGELQSIIPIIKELNKKNKNLEFLITTVTLSSSNLAKQEFKKLKNVYHRFFPIDVVFIIEKFIISWKPNFIILVDSEIWPNLILKAKENKIPIGIINARITAKTYKRWMFFPGVAKKFLVYSISAWLQARKLNRIF